MNDNPGWFLRCGWAGATASLGGRRARPLGRLRARPQVLLLEDRRLMTAIIPVTSTADSGAGTLRAAVAEADALPASEGPAVIDFDLKRGAQIELTSGQLELSNTATPIEIDGPGEQALTIDAGGTSGVFQIDGGVTASISGATVTGGNVGNWGRGGDVLNEGTLTLTDVTLSGGTARSGGGLYNFGTATLVDCTVSGNSAIVFGGFFGTYLWGGGGLYNGFGASMTVAGGSITGNAGYFSAISNDGTMSVTGTTISNNTASGVKATVYNDYGSLKMEDCTISGNSSSPGGSEGILNFVYSQLTLEGCTVEDFAGGGVNNSGDATATLAGTTIRGNSGFGGLYNQWYGNATLSNCTIVGNTNNGTGPGFAPYGGGGVCNAWSIKLTGCTISDNSSATGGGGLANLVSATLTDCTFIGNSGDEGGGIYNNYGTLTATNLSLMGNSAATGGGLDNVAGATATITGAMIVSNRASGAGGGIANTGTLELTGALILDNHAAGDGGGLYDGGTATLIDCLVSGNSAAGGGGIYGTTASSTTLTDTLVVLNKKDNIEGPVTCG